MLLSTVERIERGPLDSEFEKKAIIMVSKVINVMNSGSKLFSKSEILLL